MAEIYHWVTYCTGLAKDEVSGTAIVALFVDVQWYRYMQMDEDALKLLARLQDHVICGRSMQVNTADCMHRDVLHVDDSDSDDSDSDDSDSDDNDSDDSDSDNSGDDSGSLNIEDIGLPQGIEL
jgi:hypothetical protein